MTAAEQTEGAPEIAGLTAAQVEESRREHGANVLTPPARDPWWRLFLEKFDDPVIRILMVAAVIAVSVGVTTGKSEEGVGIIAAILLATTLAFLNEYRANKEFDILNKTNDEIPIKVIRDRRHTTVPRKDLVVGDVVLIHQGDEIPADGDLLEAVSLQVNEASLTGESLPATKAAMGPGGPASGLTAYSPERAFRGTMVLDGHGIVEVTAVGNASEIGKTTIEAAKDTQDETPLNAQLARLSKVIGVVGFGVAALLFAALVVRAVVAGDIALSTPQWIFAALLSVGVGIALAKVWLPVLYDAIELAGKEAKPPAWIEAEGLVAWLKLAGLGGAVFALGAGAGYLLGLLPQSPSQWLPQAAGQEFLRFFMVAVTVIVVAVPEGLAMSVTLSLAYSMRKLTAANNLVRRMHACETIGAATVICSDKTGTLTRNEMRIHQVRFPALGLPVSPATLDTPAGKRVVEAITANTTAHLDRAPKAPAQPIGNPTEGALLLWLEDLGLDYIDARRDFRLKVQWTFSTERKFMATLGTSSLAKEKVLYVKGAPEIVLARCQRLLGEDGECPMNDRADVILEELRSFQRRGMRTLGFAYKVLAEDAEEGDVEAAVRGLTWLGFAAIADPVRLEVPSAVAACSKAGVQIKMVTGDNVETAREIARQIGLTDTPEGDGAVLTGQAFEAMSDTEADQAVDGLKVLARARPMHKLRLVESLKRRGHVVAVTGDGTNDAPALNHAAVGLAMGKTGTAIAKEASSIILLDDSFRSIVNAILWGRSLYENIQRFILFQLTVNVAALGIALVGPFLGVALPLTVTQMLWVNLIMDTFAALALATEPPHASVMERPPRDAKAFIVTPPLAKSIFGVGAVFLVVLVALLLHIRQGGVTDYELSLFFTAFVMLQFWNLFNARCLGGRQSAFTGILSNKGFLAIAGTILAGQVLMIQFGGAAFRTTPLTARDWFMVVAGTSLVLWVGEAVRLAARVRSGSRRRPSANAPSIV